MSQLMIPFTHLLKAAREEKKLSQRALAELAGVPQSHISNIENGKVNIRISSLFEIARVLELEPMLIPRRYVPAVKGFMQNKTSSDNFEPAFTLDEDDDD
jgi:transcriptional regulator with XRE-family HTH domain